jgi:Glycosyltransferase family 87
MHLKLHFKNNWFYYLGGLVIFIIILIEARGTGDFFIFLSASKDLLAKKNIYQIDYVDSFHYYYNVLFALVLTPFIYLPLYLVKIIWLVLNVFFIYRIWQIIKDWLPFQTLSVKAQKALTVLSFVFMLRFLRDNIHLAQMTICILYLSLEGLSLIFKNKILAGSLLLAIGIDIKLLPIVFIPYLLYKGQWKALAYVTSIILILLLLPSIFIGFDYNLFLLHERWDLLNPMKQAHVLDTSEISFHSLTTLLATLLVKDCGDMYALPIKRNITDLSIVQLNIVINSVRACFVLLTFYFLRSLPFKNNNTKLERLYEIGYLCMVIPLIFPHQQHYAFVFIFPAISYLLYFTMQRYYLISDSNSIANFKLKKITLLISLFIVYFLTNSHFVLGVFNPYYNHFKTLTYGVLLLVILLAFCQPKKIETHVAK